MNYSEEATFDECAKQVLPLLEKMVDISKATGGITFQKFKWDLEAIQARIGKKMEEFKLVEQGVEDKKKSAQGIIEVATEQANKILESARKKNLQAEKNLMAVKDFCQGIEKKQYNQLKEKISA